jgi:hypothetical protein
VLRKVLAAWEQGKRGRAVANEILGAHEQENRAFAVAREVSWSQPTTKIIHSGNKRCSYVPVSVKNHPQW